MQVNFVNKANLMLFLVYLSISTCFGPLRAIHQEKQLCLGDTWYLLFCVNDCLVCSHPHRIISTKCRINTVVSLDDGHIVAWKMQRLTNVLRIYILRINYAPSWLHLQDYKGMHGQQNIKKLVNLVRKWFSFYSCKVYYKISFALESLYTNSPPILWLIQ